MKQIKKTFSDMLILLIFVAGLTFVLTSFLLLFRFHRDYIVPARYAERLLVSVRCEDGLRPDSIYCYGITPGNKILRLDTDSTDKKWNAYYGFFRELLIYIPEKDTLKHIRVSLTCGNSVISYTHHQLILKDPGFVLTRKQGHTAYLIPSQKVPGVSTARKYCLVLTRIPPFYLILIMMITGFLFIAFCRRVSKLLLTTLSNIPKKTVLLIRWLVINTHNTSENIRRLFHMRRCVIITFLNRYKRVFFYIKIIAGSVAASFFIFYLWLLLRYGTAGRYTLFVVLSGLWFLCYAFFRIIFFRNRRRKKLIRRYVITSILILSLIFSGELFFRIKGNYMTYNEVRGYFYTSGFKENYLNIEPPGFRIHEKNAIIGDYFPEYTYSKTSNSEGICDKEHPLNKSENEFRIMGVGNSFTEGQGAPQDSSWLMQMKYAIDSAHPRYDVTVINSGVAGNDIFFSYMLFKERMIKYDPDIVVIPVGPTDIDFIRYRGGMERFMPDGTVRYRKGPWWEWLYAMSHLFRYCVHGIAGYDNTFLTPEQKREETSHALLLIDEVLQEFRILSEKNNFKLLVVFFPDPKTFKKNSFVFDPLISKMQKRGDIPVFSLYEYYKNTIGMSYNNYTRYYWPHDAHHRSYGYGVFAGGIKHKLSELGYLDPLFYDTDSIR